MTCGHGTSAGTRDDQNGAAIARFETSEIAQSLRGRRGLFRVVALAAAARVPRVSRIIYTGGLIVDPSKPEVAPRRFHPGLDRLFPSSTALSASARETNNRAQNANWRDADPLRHLEQLPQEVGVREVRMTPQYDGGSRARIQAGRRSRFRKTSQVIAVK